MSERRLALADTLRSRLWPVPSLGVLLAASAGVALPELEGAMERHMGPQLKELVFGGGADAAREVLGAIATSMITVTSLTFSLTVITLQLASSQYTPRLLRTFTADRFVQNTLALFLATFVYALTVLRTVRNDSDRVAAFVPRVAVTVGSLLAVASVLALVMFLSHLVRQIRIETMLEHVAAEAKRTADRLLESADEDMKKESDPAPPSNTTVIGAPTSGFLVRIDERALLAAAIEAEAVLRIDIPVGGSVSEGVPVGYCWSVDPVQPTEGENARILRERVPSAMRIGPERTATQDIGYGLRQLTDVVVRALSPGINDPTTAVRGLNSCSAVLCHLSGRRLGQHVVRDDAGGVRLILARPGLTELLDLVCTQPQIYGARDPMVLDALLSLLRDLAWSVSTPEHQDAVADRLRRMRATMDEQELDPVDRRRLEQLADLVHDTLWHSPTSP